MSGSGIRWAICKFAPRSRHITTPAPHRSVFYRPDALPVAQRTVSKHWRLENSTSAKTNINYSQWHLWNEFREILAQHCPRPASDGEMNSADVTGNGNGSNLRIHNLTNSTTQYTDPQLCFISLFSKSHSALSQLKLFQYRRSPFMSYICSQSYIYTHPFNCPLSGTTRVSQYQKGKTNLDFTEARDSEWQWHQLGCMQVGTSLQTDNHAKTPPFSLIYIKANLCVCLFLCSLCTVTGFWAKFSMWHPHTRRFLQLPCDATNHGCKLMAKAATVEWPYDRLMDSKLPSLLYFNIFSIYVYTYIYTGQVLR